MSSLKRPNIDDVDDMQEMMDIMKNIGISTKGLKTLDEMKTKAKEHIRRHSSDTTSKAFSVVSKAKDEDMRKREHLRQLFSQTTECVDKLDEPALSVLNKNFDDVKNRIITNQNRLVEKDYYILVAGETGSGKSSFLNLLLGEELLPCAILSSTSTICELKYGTQRELVLHFKDVDPETGKPTKSIPLHENTSYMEQISSYVYMKSDREKGSPFKKVEIFWPHESLQTGITVIDSPGIGESEIMDETVEKYLANAFAFIYVINCANAGGVQQDRIVKLLRGVKKLSDERSEPFPSKCALFVCNKWDTINEAEKKGVKEHISKELKRCWPDLNARSQIVYLSTKQATDAKVHGVISPDFQVFVTRINAMILTAMETRLQSHWEWLHYLLSRIVYQTKAYIYNAKRSREDVVEQMKEVATQIKKIEDNQDVVIKELEYHLDVNLMETVQKLITHLKSKDIQSKFCTWSNEDVVKKEAKSWSVTGPAIMKVLESRLRLFIQEWEEENHVLANTKSSLKQHIMKKWNLIESQLGQLENDVNPEDGEDADDTDDDNNNLSIRKKVAIGLAIPLLPLGIAVGVFAAPILGIMGIKDRIADAKTLKKFKKDPVAFLTTLSFAYLDENASESKLFPFVKPQFDEAMRYISHMRARIPEIIAENKKLIWQLEVNTDSTNDLFGLYSPIYKQSLQIKGEVDLLGVSEIRRIDIHESNLKYGKLLGDGDFGKVFQGKWKSNEGLIDVAIKVFHQALDSSTVSSFLEEDENLRKLNHPHIVKLHGATLKKVKNGTKMILVMELCKDSLRNYIGIHKERVPGKSQNPADLKRFVQWVIEITDALQYMHKKGIVHRDLRLGNILVTKSESVKVVDVGTLERKEDYMLSKNYTCTSLYMAPEMQFGSDKYVEYASAVDMYSLGIMMWEMWYGEVAFHEYHELTTSREFEKMVRVEGVRPTHVTTCQEPHKCWQQVMEQCWAALQNNRPTAESCHQTLKSMHKSLV